ncbi:MAG: hypothetical protein GC191_09280 [Azospirillum sp.]|nr:hypothetical protein [Azospirillum sp.]
MAFQIKDFLSIVASMVNHMRAVTDKITDYNVGSVARTMVEAPAVEIDELYQQMVHGLTEAIPTAIYRSFDFPLIGAIPASGAVKFLVNPAHTLDITIPAGTQVASKTNATYLTVAEAVVPVGIASTDVLVAAEIAGPIGNALPGTVTRLVSSVSGVTSVTNADALINGRDVETDDERRLRFAEYIRSLARGTIGALVYGAKLAQVTDPVSGAILERVARVSVEETRGHVNLYVHNGTGNTSADLLQLVRDKIEGSEDSGGTLLAGYRPAGMRVDVLTLNEVPVDVDVIAQVATIYRTDDTEAQIVTALSRVIRATLSGGLLRPVDLINAVLGVSRVSGGEISSPTLTTYCPADSVLVPGAITVTWQ